LNTLPQNKVKHPQHIICVPASVVEHRANGLVDYQLTNADLTIKRRHELEDSFDYRQVLALVVFTYHGKVWAYERTDSGGEDDLHNKVAVLVGGHWDFGDLVHFDSVIDVAASEQAALERELREEVVVTSSILSKKEMPLKICADDEPVDRKHMCTVFHVELDGEGLAANTNDEDLKDIGFIDPEELLAGPYNLETWARITCEQLIKAS